jgi:hypothetical protein
MPAQLAVAHQLLGQVRGAQHLAGEALLEEPGQGLSQRIVEAHHLVTGRPPGVTASLTGPAP